MSLRRFHELFILAAIVMAELYGAWAIRHFRSHQDPGILWLRIGTLIGGLGVCVYAWLFQREMDGEGIE